MQGCVDPKPKKKTQKRVKHKKKRKGVSRDPLSNSRKRCRKKSPEKLGKTLLAAPTRPFSATSPTRTQNATHPRTKNFTNWPRPRKRRKTSFSKRPQFCSPKPSFAFQTQCGQKFELLKKQICETRKNYFPESCAELRRCKASKLGKASRRGTKTHNCSETPCFEAFHVVLPLGVRQDPRRQRGEKDENFPNRKKSVK